MRQTWIRIIAAALFILGQVSGGAVPAAGEAVCQLACCSGSVCTCDMALRNAPTKPAPASPVRMLVKDLKAIPVVVQLPELAYVSLPPAIPARRAPLDLRLPHSLPPLALHCTLLI